MTVAEVIASDDRRLLAEVSKWAHANGWTDGGWRGYMNARYPGDASIYVRPNETGFIVWRKESGHPFNGRPDEYPATSVREAVDLLVALRILPDRFSSAFYAGVDACQPTMRRLVDGLVFGTARDYVRLRQQVDVEEARNWYFTFGAGQQFDGRYVRLFGTYNETRSLMNRVFGHAWCEQYPSDEAAGVVKYGLARLHKSEWPQHDEQAGE